MVTPQLAVSPAFVQGLAPFDSGLLTQNFTHQNSWLKPEKSRLESPNMELTKSTNRHIFDAEKHEDMLNRISGTLIFLDL
jgi:hypothetical protein